jgi:tRNA uridine 5-carboxymethylaminomethyl modification enzyme
MNYATVTREQLVGIWPQIGDISAEVMEQLQTESLYASYLDRQTLDIESFKKEEGMRIPEWLDYDILPSLSNEIKLKLKAAAPETIGMASRIPGMTPAALSALIAFIKKGHVKQVAACA